MDGQRMHAARKLVRQRRVDHAMALDPALPAERFRHNIKPEVGFSAGVVSGMPFMQMRFVFDAKAFWRESRCQFRRNNVLHSHDFGLSEANRLTQWRAAFK